MLSNTNCLETQVKQIVTKSSTFSDVLVALERQYASCETDLSIRMEIRKMAMLPNYPKAARISELLAELDHYAGQLMPGLYSSTELLLWLVAKMPGDIWDELGLRRSVNEEPSPMTTCLSFFWSWRWRRRVTSTSTPTALEEATLRTMAVGIKDLNLDKALPLRMPAT